MKTLIGALVALGLASTSASAWYCPPGYGYGYAPRYSQGYGYHKPTSGYAQAPKVAVKPAAKAAAPAEPEAAPEAPPAEPAPQK